MLNFSLVECGCIQSPNITFDYINVYENFVKVEGIN